MTLVLASIYDHVLFLEVFDVFGCKLQEPWEPFRNLYGLLWVDTIWPNLTGNRLSTVDS